MLDFLCKLQAFALYKKEGMNAVAETYPEWVSFVKEHRLLSYRQLKDKLQFDI